MDTKPVTNSTPPPVPNASTSGSSWFGTIYNRVKSFWPKPSQPQKGGKPSKKTRNSRKRGGYVIKKPNSKSRSRRKSK